MRTHAPLLLAALLACDVEKDTADPEPTDTGTETVITDSDGDGFPAEEDCDDTDAAVNPSVSEVCDGVDNNCDGSIDEGLTETFYADADGDGYGDLSAPAEACEVPTGHVADSTDCDDGRLDVNPGAPEVCDEAETDEDCDGLVNDDDKDPEGGDTWYADADGDGYGDPDSAVEACARPGDTSADSDDCDDTVFGQRCWTDTWTGTFDIDLSVPDLSIKDSCSGSMSLDVDLDSDPMIDGTASCVTTTVGTLSFTISGNIDSSDQITGDITATGYFTARWTGDITDDRIEGGGGGTDTSTGFSIDYEMALYATP